MRYQPYQYEYEALASISDKEILDYFLLRVFETEEVWGLKTGAHWFYNGDQQLTLPLWPYQQLAAEAATGEWQHLQAEAESLEFFMYNLLDDLELEDIQVEIMPGPDKPGSLIPAAKLFNILEGMFEVGTYTLDQ